MNLKWIFPCYIWQLITSGEKTISRYTCLQVSKISSYPHSLFSIIGRNQTFNGLNVGAGSCSTASSPQAELTCLWERGCPCDVVRCVLLSPNPCHYADNSVIRDKSFRVHALRFVMDLFRGCILTEQYPTLIPYNALVYQIVSL